MSTARPAAIVRQLEQSVLPGDPAGDRDLLDRFARRRDQAAFTLLVRRHGPMVLGVCRRVTAHPQDAEDAFQAAFLVLAKKAAAVRNPELLGNWLYGVAVRVAGKARRSAARRRVREVQVSAMPDPSTTPAEPMSDLGPVLHEELAALPACYRDPIVLCDLRGASRAEAAKALGIPEGTLSSRLASGRKKLADRLTRRGVALAAMAVPAALAAGPAAAAVPDSLVAKTCGLVADWSAGCAVPFPVARLAEGGFSVRKLMLIGMFATALAAGGAVLAAQSDDPANPPAPPATVPVRVAAPAPAPDGKASALAAHPRLRVAVDLALPRVDQVCWSSDGKALAVRGAMVRTQDEGGGVAVNAQRNTLMLIPNAFEANPSKLTVNLDKLGRLVGFTPDGKQVVTELREYDLVSGFHKLQFWEVMEVRQVPLLGTPGAPGGETRTQELKLARVVDLDAEPTYGYAFAADGKTFRTVHREVNARNRTGSVWDFKSIEVREVSAETGRTLRTLLKLDGDQRGYALSPNGKRFAAVDTEKEKDRLTAWDLDTGKKLWVQVMPDRAEDDDPNVPRANSLSIHPDVAFSPDGRRVVCFRVTEPTVVMDADKGDVLPVPEQGERMMATADFTGDGKLMVATGSRAVTERRAGGGDDRGNPFGAGGLGQRGQPGFGGVGGKGGAKGMAGGAAPRLQTVVTYVGFLGIWDAASGKRLKFWDNKGTHVAAHPTRPVVAILESNGSGGVRLGLWDFAPDADRK